MSLRVLLGRSILRPANTTLWRGAVQIRRESNISSPTPASNTTLAGEKIDPWHGSYHWIYERGLSVATLGLVGAALISPHKAVDFALGVVLPLHCHLGFDSVIVDYLPKRKFPTIYPLVKALLYIATAGTLYGLYQYNTKDVGISEGFGRLWNAPKKQDNEK